MKSMFRCILAVGLASLFVLAAGCGGQAVGEAEWEQSTLEGAVVELAIDDLNTGAASELLSPPFEGGEVSDTRYLLRVGIGQTFALNFSETPELEIGETLRVHGERLGEAGFTVTSWERLDDESDVRRAALTGNSLRTGMKVLALVVHHGPTPPDEPSTKATVASALTGDLSAHKVLLESSYGLVTLAEYAVHGDLAVPRPDTCDLASFLNMANQAETAAIAANINVSYFDKVMFVFPHRDDCGFHGRADLGSPLLPARNSYFNGPPTCGGLSHEFLHNFGARHSHSYACGAQRLDVPANCTPASEYDHMTPAEYGNSFDPMGRSRCIQFGSETRRQQQWLGACNVVDVGVSTTFELAPLDAPSNAIQMLRVPLPSTRCPTNVSSCFVSVEYRQPLGVVESNPSQDPRVFAGLPLAIVATNGPSTPYLLDMTPLSLSGFYDGALLPSRLFSDVPSGVTIQLLSRNSTRALVRVTLPSANPAVNTCTGGSTVLPPLEAPATCRDGIKNGSEAAIDCGGSSCWPCDDGKACQVNSDCHNRCVSSLCAPNAPTCTDGAKNGAETDRDCGGGTCSLCAAGQNCLNNSDCRGGQCILSTICKLPDSCKNGARDGTESDSDCGGNICNLCERDQLCNTNADCLSNSCVGGHCTT